MHSQPRYRWAPALHRPSLWWPTVWVERYSVTKSCWVGLRQPCAKLISPICSEAPKVACIFYLLNVFSNVGMLPYHSILLSGVCGGIFAIQVIKILWTGLQKHLHPGAAFALNIQVRQDTCSPLFNIVFSTRARSHAHNAWQGCEIDVFVSLVAEVRLFRRKPVRLTWPVTIQSAHKPTVQRWLVTDCLCAVSIVVFMVLSLALVTCFFFLLKMPGSSLFLSISFVLGS